jgi:hypothetical protein
LTEIPSFKKDHVILSELIQSLRKRSLV